MNLRELGGAFLPRRLFGFRRLELDAKLQFPRLATGARRHNTAGSPSEACVSLIRTSEEND
jgi:hypothetical protein